MRLLKTPAIPISSGWKSLCMTSALMDVIVGPVISTGMPALSLESDHLNTNEVFNPEHLPLFQSVGTQSSIEGRSSLHGLGAAALPRAEQGLALGLSETQGGQKLFARLAFRRESTEEADDLHLTPTLTPPAAGVRLDADDLLVLDDRSASVWVIRAIPDQQQVGSHAFTLTRGLG